MAHPSVKIDRPFTYGDYVTWPAGERWEIIDGTPLNMAPAPVRRHQKISMNLIRLLADGMGGSCELYHAPFDVRLPERDEADEDIVTVVQPDLSIIGDPSKLDDFGCRGAPDLIIEIVSPGSAGRDMKIKRDLYERHGVRDYWIVQPEERIIMVYVLKNGIYGKGAVFTEDEEASLQILPEIRIPLTLVFQDPLARAQTKRPEL
jgi:Uma2 family endonuclease